MREFAWGLEQATALARRIQGRPGSRDRIEEMAEALTSRGQLPGMEGCAGMVAAARYDLFDHAADVNAEGTVVFPATTGVFDAGQYAAALVEPAGSPETLAAKPE